MGHYFLGINYVILMNGDVMRNNRHDQLKGMKNKRWQDGSLEHVAHI